MFGQRTGKGGDPGGHAEELVGPRGRREAHDHPLLGALTHTLSTHRSFNKKPHHHPPSLKGLNFVPVKTHLI